MAYDTVCVVERAALVAAFAALLALGGRAPVRHVRADPRGDARRVAAVRGVLAQHGDTAVQAVVALGFPAGADPAVPIKRWERPVRVKVGGAPSSEDVEAVRDAVRELATAVPDLPIAMAEGDAAGNVEIRFVPPAAFGAHIVGAQAPAYVWTWWEASGDLYRSAVLVDSTLSVSVRALLARRYLVRALGLFQDDDALAAMFDGPAFGKDVVNAVRLFYARALPDDATRGEFDAALAELGGAR